MNLATLYKSLFGTVGNTFTNINLSTSKIFKSVSATITLGVIGMSMIGSQSAQAHPHAYSAITAQIIDTYPRDLNIKATTFGEIGRFKRPELGTDQHPIYGLIFTMVMDQISSAPLVVDIQRGKRLELIEEVAGNLIAANFFTKAALLTQVQKTRADGSVYWDAEHPLEAPFDFAKAISMIDLKVLDDQKVELKYAAWFKEPLVFKDHEYLRLKTYDRSYWVQIKYHHPNDDVSFTDKTSKNNCDWYVEDASPSQSLIDYASSLKADENPNDPDLGRHFAQTLFIGCPLYHN